MYLKIWWREKVYIDKKKKHFKYIGTQQHHTSTQGVNILELHPSPRTTAQALINDNLINLRHTQLLPHHNTNTSSWIGDFSMFTTKEIFYEGIAQTQILPRMRFPLMNTNLTSHRFTM